MEQAFFAQESTTRSDGGNVGLFVDSENLSLWAQGHASVQPSPTIDYGALLRFAGESGRVVGAAVYTSRVNGDDRHIRFLVALKRAGFTRVVSRTRRRLPDGRCKASSDVSLVIDAWDAITKKEIKSLVLVTGDGDFVPLVDRAVEAGVAVHVIGPDGSTAPELVVAATHFTLASRVTGLVRDSALTGVVVDRPATCGGEERASA